MSNTTKIITEPGTPFVSIERTFDAPAELVLRAHTEPELLVQWMGPRYLTMTVDELDASHGGRYRYTHADPDGNAYAFRGVFHGTPSVEGGIVQTFEFEGMPGHITLEKLTFDEVGGRTTIRGLSTFQSVADRDAMVESGMETGIVEGYEQLDELLASVHAG